VFVLPYIGQAGSDLFEQYDLAEPWDGPGNIQLVEQVPAHYRHPNSQAERGDTSYYVLVGPGTVCGGDPAILSGGGMKLTDIANLDGSSNTILIVEADRAVPWTKPEDIPYDPDGELPALGGFSPARFFNAAFCDGSVRRISADIDPDVLRALITVDDGREIPPDAFE
jgi:prepilin-type processing-associated H-X9-DG protein